MLERQSVKVVRLGSSRKYKTCWSSQTAVGTPLNMSLILVVTIGTTMNLSVLFLVLIINAIIHRIITIDVFAS